MIEMIKCKECGKMFTPGNRPDGLPNGVGFQLDDGSIYSVCADCLMEVGRKLEEGEQE